MSMRFQLVYAGEVLEGHDPGRVRQGLAERLRLDDARLAQLMAASRKTIRRDLNMEQALNWRDQFAALGARLHIEPMDTPAPVPTAAPAPALAPDTPLRAAALTPPPGLALVEPSPEDTALCCPACQTRQRQALRCRSCGVDIAQAQADARAQADLERAERRAEALRRRGLRTEAARDPNEREGWGGGQQVPLLSLSMAGRIGRMRNLQCTLMSICLLIWLAGLAIVMPNVMGLILLLLGALLISLWGTRIMVLRLHDLGHSGWWGLLLLVPMLGTLVGLGLSLVPGDPGENDHGVPPQEESHVPALIWAVLISLTLSLSWQQATRALGRMREAPPSQTTPQDGDVNTGMGGPQPSGPQRAELVAALGSEAAADAFLAYAQAGTHRAFALGGGGAFGWQAGRNSVNDAKAQAISECEARRRPYTTACQLINVNGMRYTDPRSHRASRL